MYTLEEIKTDDIGEDVLIDYLASNDVKEAIAAAQNPYATEVVLAIAALDQDVEIRLLVLQHKSVADRTVLKLCQDDDMQVREAARIIAGRRGL